MLRAMFCQGIALVVFVSAAGRGDVLAADPNPSPALGVWDTGKASRETFTPAGLKEKDGWTKVASGETLDSFKGDAAMANGRILAVVRRNAAAVEVFAETVDGAAERFQLVLIGEDGTPASKLEKVTLAENSKGAVAFDLVYKTAKKATVGAKIRLKKGEVALETQPGESASRLRIECRGRFLALPDFFADDIVVDARKISLPLIEVPSENFLMHLRGKGEAIAMCVFENRKQDAIVTLSGDGDARTVTGSEIPFEGKKIWVATLEGPEVWHARELKADDAGKVLPLDWKMPYKAQWRVDFTKTSGLTDSWEMLLQQEKGDGYIKPSWMGGGDQHLNAKRERWNTVLGDFTFPCWSDRERKGYLQPLKNEALTFQGPAIVYPINRVKETPLDAYTVVDVMRSTLGVGPCEHILDLEGQKAEYKGRATCACRDGLGEIYGKKQQKEKRKEVEKILDDGLIFVKHIRGRITRYVEFGHKMRDYLAEQKKAHPELSDSLTELDKIVQEIESRVAARATNIKTPDDVARMNEEFRKNVLDYEGKDALDRCREYSEALVEIGGNQDELSAECRWVVKTLRQRAGLMLATNPKLAEVAGEIRAKTQEALRNPANHEGARH
jgi:hypothetical protein